MLAALCILPTPIPVEYYVEVWGWNSTANLKKTICYSWFLYWRCSLVQLRSHAYWGHWFYGNIIHHHGVGCIEGYLDSSQTKKFINSQLADRTAGEQVKKWINELADMPAWVWRNSLSHEDLITLCSFVLQIHIIYVYHVKNIHCNPIFWDIGHSWFHYLERHSNQRACGVSNPLQVVSYLCSGKTTMSVQHSLTSSGRLGYSVIPIRNTCRCILLS